MVPFLVLVQTAHSITAFSKRPRAGRKATCFHVLCLTFAHLRNGADTASANPFLTGDLVRWMNHVWTSLEFFGGKLLQKSINAMLFESLSDLP